MIDGSRMDTLTEGVSCGRISDDTITGDSVTVRSVFGIEGVTVIEELGLRRIMNHTTPHSTISKTTTPPIIIISEEAHIDATHFDHSFCLNTRSRNPISSFPIFIPNVTFRRSDSVPPRAESSCTSILIEIISQILGYARNAPSEIPCSANIAGGNIESFLIDSHISRVEPERFESLF